MIEYKRFISYMYTYVNGEKQHNSGYAKIEAKNGTCKLSVNIKSNSLIGQTLNIYIFYRDDDKKSIIAIPAGSSVVKNNICDCMFKTDKENIFESNLKLDNMGGVIATTSDGRVFATEWDDIVINPLEFKLHSSDSSKITFPSQSVKPNKELKQDNLSDAILESTEPIKASVSKSVKTPKLVDLVDIELHSSSTDSPAVKTIAKEEKVQKSVLQKEVSKDTSIDKKTFPVPNDLKTIVKSDMPSNNASTKQLSGVNRIFEYLPGMYPFEDDEIMDCVKLEPHDIGMFPMDKWVLANNSFLLHGYYTYRHLIFAKKRSKGQAKYILGVPGLYRDRDRFMANMFGFSEFKGVRNVPRSIGDFGYWYMEIRL